MAARIAPVHLLWTGGWDSTFELLRQLFVHRTRVVPIYLIDSRRRSHGIEMRSMDRIRERITGLDAQAGTRLMPTWLGQVDRVAPDAAVTAAFMRLQRRFGIGSQYEWLARFCVQHRLDGVVLGYEDGRFGSQRVLCDTMEEVSEWGDRVYRVRADAADDVLTVFGRYLLPLYDWTKRDMARVVDAEGWRSVMVETWFCHRPVGEVPCARCHPCIQTIDAGLGWRISPARRALGLLQRAAIDRPRDFLRPVAHALRAAAADRRGMH